MKNRPILYKILLGILLGVGSILFINPNPFGNQPAVIADETYFLTTAVKALQSHSIPGFAIDPTGAYYGGILTYAIYAALCIGGAVSVAVGVHLQDLPKIIAYHWGDLMHIGRIINGVTIYGIFIWIGWTSRLLSKKYNDPEFKRLGFFLIALLCSSSVFLPIVHTSKIWPIYLAIELAAGWLVISTEWKKRHDSQINGPRHFNRLVILTLLSWSQNLFGSLTVLWILDALLLKQFTWEDIKSSLTKPFIWICTIATVALNFSFIKNFIHYYSAQVSILATANGNVATAHYSIVDRFIWPIIALFKTDPLVLILLCISVFIICLLKYLPPIQKIIFIHLGLLYLMFHVGMAFGMEYRYILPLSVICAFSVAVWITSTRPPFRHVSAIAILLMAIAVSLKTAWLFWHPSSVARMDQIIATAPITNRDLLIVKDGYFQFPVLNKASIAITQASTGSEVFRRFMVLADDPRYLAKAPNFTVALTSSAIVTTSTFEQTWILDDRVPTACTDQNDCISINTSTNKPEGSGVAEGTDIVSLFQADTIGRAYILKKD